MALVVRNRVQETGTANTTVSFTLNGAVTGFQSFASIGNNNTTYYTATDASGSWEVGLGTYDTSGPTLVRNTILASSNTGSAVTFSGDVNVFVTYPSDTAVYSNGTNLVGPTNIPLQVSNGGTGVIASSGPNSVVLRDANQNIAVNRVNQANTTTTAAGGTTALTAASTYIHSLVGTGGQTYTLPDATTLATGVAFLFNNLATGTLTIQDYATGPVGTIPTGGAGAVFLTNNGTVGGTWDLHAYLPEGVTFGTNAFNLGTAVVSGGTWQGGTIQPAYGGTGLTTFTASNNALYSTGASTLTAGTLPILAGGTGETTRQAAIDALAGAVTSGQYLRGNGSDVVMSAIQAADVPTLNQNTTGSAATLTTGRTIAITGDLSYTSPSFNGSGNVTAAGTLATVNSNVGSFTNASVTVNAKGLVTAASSGTAPVTSVTGTAPVVSSGGTTPAISMPAATTSVNGYLTSTDWNTFNSKGSGTVTSISAGTGLSGGTITGSGTIALANTAVSAGSYTNANITVDAQGRLTAASSGSGGSGTVTSVSGTGTVNGISLSGTVTSSGSLTLGGTLSGVSLTSQVSGALPVANGGTGSTTAANARTALGAAALQGTASVFGGAKFSLSGTTLTITTV